MARPIKNGQKKTSQLFTIHPTLLAWVKYHADEQHISMSQLLEDSLLLHIGLSPDDLSMNRLPDDTFIEPLTVVKQTVESSKPKPFKPPMIDGLDMDDYVAKIRSQIKAKGGQTSE